MNKKLLSWVVILGVISLGLTGCSNKLESENDRLNQAYLDEKAKTEEQAKEIARLNEQVETLNQKAKENELLGLTAQTEIWPIYTANINDYKKEIGCYISLPKNDSIQAKLDEIAQSLSELYFHNLPIEVLEIDGQKIAHVNLKELSGGGTGNISSDSWASRYFQGSAGGTITTTRLVESFLQRQYNGEWIAGVEILYNGQPVDFQHVPDLAKVNYR